MNPYLAQACRRCRFRSPPALLGREGVDSVREGVMTGGFHLFTASPQPSPPGEGDCDFPGGSDDP